MKPEYIYGDSKDKYVASVVVHAHTDNVAYYDEAHTMSVNREEMLDYAKKGLIVVEKDDTFYRPAFYKDETSTASVTIITNDSSVAALKVSSKERDS